MKNSTRLAAVLTISIAFFCTEIVVGFRTKSLALIADAFHYLNDIVAYLIAFLASHLQEKGYKPSGFTYALHRAELVGGFFNGIFLLALALSIFLQSIERFIIIEFVKDPLLMLIVGCVGLSLNLISATIAQYGGHRHEHGHNHTSIHAMHNHTRLPPPLNPHGNLGVLAVFIHVLGDAVNNVGVIVGALVMWKTHSPARFYADPAVSLAISLIIFAGAIPLTLKTGRILLEASPIHLNLDSITEDLLASHSVLSIHDLHVWQLSQNVIVASFHVEVPVGTTLNQWEKIEGSLRECMAAYGVSHLTNQMFVPRNDRFGAL
ncbi:hypothetical protein PILCRDRAFT_94955 [Piloderma croceum F 1598]|uniref:Cation efflux protein cytoplasmic domain-containing protein n=1 Tax=Piloderma croceum (strain F 1598) TaxID=765440 RepID=A0A0C3G0G4_PILCF|nr:hypothetical protein PILCRDRAFT_94955 [Piloderma croceum F 1598]